MNFKGSCHCGLISYEVEGDLGRVMECNCSHCSRKGYLLWFVPRQQFKLAIPESELSTYTFNKHVINPHFRPKGGYAPFAFGKDKAGAETVAVNVRCLDGVDLSTLEKQPFDGRNL